jgi:hypothetical protein
MTSGYRHRLRRDLERLAADVRRGATACKVAGVDDLYVSLLDAAANEIERAAYAVERGHLPCCLDPEHDGEISRHLADEHRRGLHRLAETSGGDPECPVCRGG